MKKSTRIICALFLLVIAIFCGKRYMVYSTYQSAIVEIKNGAYEEALVKFEKANGDKLDRDTFFRDASGSPYSSYSTYKLYKDTVPLYAYALARNEYKSEEISMSAVNKYLELISTDYSGECSDEIKEFKERFQLEYDEYSAEQERLREEEFEKELERLRYTVPYVGMSEYYIAQTILGDDFEKNSSYERVNREQVKVTVYRFKRGTSTIFIAKCMKGSVTEVIDYRDSLKTTKSYSSSWSSGKTNNNDRYAVNEYRNAEDFYDDNYDNFWSYEDAEDYFNEHHN